MRGSVYLAIFGVFLVGEVAFGQMSSTNFEIRFDSINVGGSDDSTSATYQLRDSIGNLGSGIGASTSYQSAAGFRAGIFDQVITFDIFAQNNASERAATGAAGTTITTGTGGLAVGDFIVVIQDKGASQVYAIGRIVTIGVGTITVDELKDGGVAPVIDGTNDYLYLLSGSSANLGTLDATSVATAVVGFDVTAEVDGGYVVQAYDDGDLRDGAFNVNDVADGTVTAGSEEYGARSSDVSLAGSTFDTADTALTTTPTDVADESSLVFESRNFLTLKAAVTSGTDNGSYAQQLSLVVSGNY